ncbi:MAG: ABC transporter ATP-binding protein [Acidobacteriaceae bacterium]|nr:ABC transporter ATP-binding protein [Acidobacteriaceae bacterium]
MIARLVETPDLIPDAYWSVRPGPEDTDGQAQVMLRGAVLVRIRARRASSSSAIPAEAHNLTPELAAAVNERPLSPGRELFRIIRESGLWRPGAITAALALAAGATVIEALLFRTLFDVTADLKLVVQRAAAITALLLFSLIVLLLELPISSGVLRMGRQIENRLRLAFLKKIPKLGDSYFQSRLTSDMAERSHVAHRLRNLPELTRQLMRAGFGLCATAAGIIWLAPAATPLVLFAVAAALLPALMVQSLLTERDLRVRSHAAALTRFYLDAMLGLVAIRAHSAERSLRREHEKLLGEWGGAALRLQRAVVGVEAVQLTAIFGLVAWLIFSHSVQGAGIGSVLLVVYWALNLPLFGQEIAAVTRQYPHYRNLTLRLLEPLGAPEEVAPKKPAERFDRAPSLEFQQVSVQASGHTILSGINLHVAPGEHIAIVGPSGAGKSSLVGILLGWFKPCAGSVLVNGFPLNCDQVRRSIAWVDPAVQLWNRSCLANLMYGAGPQAPAVGRVIDAAFLRGVVEAMPDGLQTKLGEGGALVSGGEGQRVRLGRAMLHMPARLVILDEPFRGLDREQRRELLRGAREYWRSSTLLCITHDIEETQQFDRVLVIENGQIAEEGMPGELCRNTNSRYLQLLGAERGMRSSMWASRMWRRIHVHSGRIVEQHPEPVHDQERETEVA